MAATISLGMIVRDAGGTLDRCLESVAPYVDEIVIGLGGESTDNTEEVARKYTDKIIQIDWHDDFAEARNIVLQQVTGDYFLWLDDDDELMGGDHIRQLIIQHPEIDSFHWGYDYARNEQGQSTCYLIRERLVKNPRAWEWKGEIHEVLSGPPDHKAMFVDNILVKHYPSTRAGDRNLKVLYKQLEESEPNPDTRILMYLGSENANLGNFSEALLHYRRYITLSKWDEEKYQAMHRMADIYRATSQLDRARQMDFQAISILPNWPDAYYGLAETAYLQQNYRETIEWTKVGAEKPMPFTMMIVNPRDYDFNPMVVLGNAYLQLKDFEMAAQQYRKALEVAKEPQIEGYLQIVERELQGHRLVDAFLLLWEHLAQNDEWLKARNLFQSVPKLIERVPSVVEKLQFTARSTAHVDDPKLMERDYIENPYWAPMDEKVLRSPGWYQFPRVQWAKKVIQEVRPGNVVDLGSSDGFILLPFAHEFPEINFLGIDIDPRCVDLANERRLGDNILFYPASIDEYVEMNRAQKRDLALLFEVIEHVVDPDDLLEKVESVAEHIAITTPHLAWESPQSYWQDEGFKPHLRIFDLEDIEMLLAPRGRIHNLYREPSGDSGWIFADYKPGEKTTGHVVILAPGTPETWSPRTFEREGLGGSETAVIKLSEGFSQLGKQVSVFSRMAEEGYFKGVRYRDQNRFVPEIGCELFIAWRAPELIDYPINSSRRVLWMHDTDAGDRLTPDRAAKFTDIVVLTEWHKNHMMERYPFIPEDRFVVIPNGVDLTLFELDPEVKRNPKKVIYSSSPDRGLDRILTRIWPAVVAAVPDAELHLYYGWNNFDAFTPIMPGLADIKSTLMGLIHKSKNVVQHGRVSQKQLAREMMSAGIWLYPTEWFETYCITAIEAQTAGLVPITNDKAALKETVGSGVIFDHTNEDLDQYALAVIRHMMDPIPEEDRLRIMMKSPGKAWSEVANMWADRWLKI